MTEQEFWLNIYLNNPTYRHYLLKKDSGLSLQEEYELLCLLKEEQRLQYLKRHLQKILPLVSGIENLKDKIKLNGHFKELKGFNL